MVLLGWVRSFGAAIPHTHDGACAHTIIHTYTPTPETKSTCWYLGLEPQRQGLLSPQRRSGIHAYIYTYISTRYTIITGDFIPFSCIYIHIYPQDTNCFSYDFIHFFSFTLGLSPSARAFSSEAINEAEAPSERKEELAAVCVPWGCFLGGGGGWGHI